MRTKTVCSVRQSNDYTLFKAAKDNRGVIPGHVRNLAHEMEKHGWLDAFPMMVRESGKKLEIRDGQNRFHAAKSLGIPVKYVVVDSRQGRVPMSDFNRPQLSWKNIHYVRSYANQGRRDYQILQEFMEKHKVKLTTAATLLGKSLAASRNPIITGGDFSVNSISWAEDAIDKLKQLAEVLPWSPSKKQFLGVFVRCLQVEGFCFTRLITAMKKYPGKCIDYSQGADMARMLEEVYNHNRQAHNKIPLAFRIDEVARNGSS